MELNFWAGEIEKRPGGIEKFAWWHSKNELVGIKIGLMVLKNLLGEIDKRPDVIEKLSW